MRQGFPAAMTSAGISLVTTLPAPMTLLRPMVTPFMTVDPAPSQTLSSITMGRGSPERGSPGCQSESVMSVLAPQRIPPPQSNGAERADNRTAESAARSDCQFRLRHQG